MIKAAGVGAQGRPFALLGLSAENVRRLVAGQPIAVHLAEIDLPDIDVLITYGDTERDITEELERAGVLPRGTAAAAGDPEPGRTFRRDLRT